MGENVPGEGHCETEEGMKLYLGLFLSDSVFLYCCFSVAIKKGMETSLLSSWTIKKDTGSERGTQPR